LIGWKKIEGKYFFPLFGWVDIEDKNKEGNGYFIVSP